MKSPFNITRQRIGGTCVTFGYCLNLERLLGRPWMWPIGFSYWWAKPIPENPYTYRQFDVAIRVWTDKVITLSIWREA